MVAPISFSHPPHGLQKKIAQLSDNTHWKICGKSQDGIPKMEGPMIATIAFVEGLSLIQPEMTWIKLA